ncbi:MAG: Pilus assembly protein CpaF [Clostridiales bacterium]|nr:Pilus assembly protein CpaF [Clostridiales bacterium]
MKTFLIINLICLLICYIALLIVKRGPRQIQDEREVLSIPILVEKVKDELYELTRSNIYELGLDSDQLKKRIERRGELKQALKNCVYGSKSDREYVKEIIYGVLKDKYITEENVNDIIPFMKSHKLTSEEKFDIVLYDYKQEYGDEAINRLVGKYELAEEKVKNDVCVYDVTGEEIDDIYEKEGVVLSYKDKLKIITQRVYQDYKGLGVLDEIRFMNIDGVSGGVSGTERSIGIEENSLLRSIWMYYKGKTVRLSFMKFSSLNELKRICQNIYRYNKAGQLSECKSYIINELIDGSRVLVVRPSFSESYAFFIRRLQHNKVVLEELVTGKNSSTAIELMKFLVKGCQVTSITGSQGSGKTTLLMALVKHIYGTLTLRVQETAFELHLRNLYPTRNILSFRETEYVSGQEGLDLQKKTDGAVNILGEIATDEVAAWMLQMAQVASLFTLFTHHAKTVDTLIMSLRNSLLKCEVFNNEKIAEQQVVQVLNFDIHLNKTFDGKRYIERVTEIIPISQTKEYPSLYKENKEEFLDNIQEYFYRSTDRKQYEYVNILEYINGEYIIMNPISSQTIDDMNKYMNVKDQREFKRFIENNWGDGVEMERMAL